MLPYVGHVSESIKRLLAPLNIRTCFRSHNTLRELLVHPKDHIPDIKKPGVVYSISCKECDNVSVGQTGRTLEHRMKEHKRALCSLDVNTSAVAEHCIKKNHCIDWKSARVLKKENKLHQRCYLESWHIREQSASMNRNNGTFPQVYNNLL